MDSKTENYHQNFLSEVHSSQSHGIDLPISETQPSVKAEAVISHLEHSQFLKLKETIAVIDKEYGWVESHNEHSYEIKRDNDDAVYSKQQIDKIMTI